MIMNKGPLLPFALLTVFLGGFRANAQDGYLDASFSSDGKVVYDNGGNDENGVGIAVRTDGRIWVVANSYNASEQVLLMRFNNDGTLDVGYSGDGVQELSAGSGNTFSTCVEQLADGSLLIGGYYIDGLGYTAPLVIKVDANGALVNGFGLGGFALGTADGYRVNDLGVQSNGTIVVTMGPQADINPAVCAISASGAFGTPIQQLQCSLHDRLIGLQVQANDHVLITGYCGTEDSGTNWRALILALDPDLNGDLSFSPGYICGPLNVQTNGVEYYYSGNPLFYTNDTGNDIGVLSNGDILVAGTTIDTTGNADVYRTSLLKAHSDNSVDDAFGFQGFIKPYVGSFFKRLIVQANNTVLALGGDYSGSLALARFHTDGVLDQPFGDLGGFTHTSVGSFSTNPGDLAVQADGRILVVGTAVNNNNDVVVLRYNAGPVGIEEGTRTIAQASAFPVPSNGHTMVRCEARFTRILVTNAVGAVVIDRSFASTSVYEVDLSAAGIFHFDLFDGSRAVGGGRLVVAR